MSRVMMAVAVYEAAAEEVRNAVDIAAADGGAKMTRREIADLGERLLEGQVNGARAERRMLDVLEVLALRERQQSVIIKPAS